MRIEAELVVRVAWDGHRVSDARVASSRPVEASRTLEGRSPAEALALLPRLFGICRCAQGAASSGALAAAGADVEAVMSPADVALETVQEYFWRLLIDWPHTMRRTVDAATVSAVRRAIASEMGEPGGERRGSDASAPGALAATLSTIAEQKVYGMPPAAWLELEAGELEAWADRAATVPAELLGDLLAAMPSLGCSDVALMPTAGRAALVQVVAPAMTRESRFAAAPTWEGEPVETGALARMRSVPLVAGVLARDGNSVAARMTARLAELATLVSGLDRRAADRASLVESAPLGDDEGLGAVQTARGLLLHRVRVTRDRILSYQIVAPTEWNFHPDGALVRGLRSLVAADAAMLDQRVRLVVQALDPCVAFRIESGDA